MFFYSKIHVLLLQAYPMLNDDKEYMNKLVKNLYSNGLINTESLNITMTESVCMHLELLSLVKNL